MVYNNPSVSNETGIQNNSNTSYLNKFISPLAEFTRLVFNCFVTIPLSKLNNVVSYLRTPRDEKVEVVNTLAQKTLQVSNESQKPEGSSSTSSSTSTGEVNLNAGRNKVQFQIPAEEKLEFEGYSTKVLETIQKKVEKKGLPLHVCPKRPVKSYEINGNAAKYVEAQPEDLKKVAQKAIEKTQYISMDKFDKALKECVSELNHHLLGNSELTGEYPSENQTYELGIAYGKSNQWVASLALKDLAFTPDSCFSLGSSQGTTNVIVPTAKEEDFEQSRVVLFDDCCYSGNQMYDNIQRVASKMAKKESGEIFIVVPFMTNRAMERFEELAERVKTEGVDIKIITSEERIQTIPEIFSEKQEALLFDELTQGTATAVPNLTLCYTDWRYPDANSFVRNWGSGIVRTKMIIEDGGIREEIIRQRNIGDFIEQNIRRPYEINL